MVVTCDAPLIASVSLIAVAFAAVFAADGATDAPDAADASVIAESDVDVQTLPQDLLAGCVSTQSNRPQRCS